MRAIQCAGNLCSVRKRLRQRKRPFPQTTPERLPLQIFHHQIVRSILGPYIKERADMGVRNAGNDTRFTFEAEAQLRIIGSPGRQNLDGYSSIQASVACLVDFAHSSCTKQADNFIRPQSGAWSKRHRSPLNYTRLSTSVSSYTLD